jgi:hypothetical protein
LAQVLRTFRKSGRGRESNGAEHHQPYIVQLLVFQENVVSETLCAACSVANAGLFLCIASLMQPVRKSEAYEILKAIARK